MTGALFLYPLNVDAHEHLGLYNGTQVEKQRHQYKSPGEGMY